MVRYKTTARKTEQEIKKLRPKLKRNSLKGFNAATVQFNKIANSRTNIAKTKYYGKQEGVFIPKTQFSNMTNRILRIHDRVGKYSLTPAATISLQHAVENSLRKLIHKSSDLALYCKRIGINPYDVVKVNELNDRYEKLDGEINEPK